MSSWHYGPTESDPDPGKMWHYECGGEVASDGYHWVCLSCNQRGEESTSPLHTGVVAETQTIFKLVRAGRKNVVYASHDDEDGPSHTIAIDPDTFDYMGRPEIVTVAVRPGDHLNDPSGDR